MDSNWVIGDCKVCGRRGVHIQKKQRACGDCYDETAVKEKRTRKPNVKPTALQEEANALLAEAGEAPEKKKRNTGKKG